MLKKDFIHVVFFLFSLLYFDLHRNLISQWNFGYIWCQNVNLFDLLIREWSGLGESEEQEGFKSSPCENCRHLCKTQWVLMEFKMDF